VEPLAAELERAQQAVDVGFDPDLLELTDEEIQRQIVRQLGFLPMDEKELAAVRELVLVNEMDMRIAAAIEHGIPFEEDLKEQALASLEQRMSAAVAHLSPRLRDAWYQIAAPVWVYDGRAASWVDTVPAVATVPAISTPTIGTLTVSTRPRERRARRTQRARAPAGGDDPPLPPRSLGQHLRPPLSADVRAFLKTEVDRRRRRIVAAGLVATPEELVLFDEDRQ
jgi:hypothetical protein